MVLDYITNDNTIIFNYLYNKPLRLSPELTSHYKKIIFSNYALHAGLFEAYENGKLKDLRLYGSEFNQPLANSLKNCTSLTHLTFGTQFNCHLHNSLENCTVLTHLVFGHCFDQSLDNSLENCTALTYLTFGSQFNQPLVNSLNNYTRLTHLTFGYYFNQK